MESQAIRIRVRRLFYLALSSLAVAAALIGVGAWYTWAALETALNDRVLVLRDIKEISDAYEVTILNSLNLAAQGDLEPRQALDNISTAQGVAKLALGRLFKSDLPTGGQKFDQELVSKVAATDDYLEDFKRALIAGDQKRLDEMITARLYSVVTAVTNALTRLTSLEAETAKAEFAVSVDVLILRTVIVLAIILLTILVILVAMRQAEQRIVSPIEIITDLMNRIACGEVELGQDLKTRISATRTHEFITLYSAFETFQATVRQKMLRTKNFAVHSELDRLMPR
jgi:methyl-accepting chemotaxis protein